MAELVGIVLHFVAGIKSILSKEPQLKGFKCPKILAELRMIMGL